MKDTIARPYSEAVFAQAKQDSSFGSWSEALTFLSAVMADEQIQSVMGSPSHTEAQLEELLLGIAGEFSDKQQNFLKLLVQNKRLDVVVEIAEQFEALCAENENRVMVEVTSAYALSEDEVSGIVKTLETKLSSKITVETAVDESLIGGIVIRAGDMVIDTTVRGQVAQFSQSLTS